MSNCCNPIWLGSSLTSAACGSESLLKDRPFTISWVVTTVKIRSATCTILYRAMWFILSQALAVSDEVFVRLEPVKIGWIPNATGLVRKRENWHLFNSRLAVRERASVRQYSYR